MGLNKYRGTKTYSLESPKPEKTSEEKIEKRTSPAGRLQPLQLPVQVWSDISMDFIDGLPKSWGKSVLLVVVDRFSKYAHFIPIAHPYTAVRVAQVFFEQIVRLHGLPETITCDRDVVFTSAFWKELFCLNGTKLQFSTAYHPQTDGQTEVVNRTVEMYLRCFVGDFPKKWVAWVPWAEYCYNTSFHSALQTTPFRVVYGQDPPRLLSYVTYSSRVEAVNTALVDRDAALHEIRGKLLQAQQRMKMYYDKGHRDLEFSIGDLVWLRLHAYRQRSLGTSGSHKLSPRFFGPFTVVRKVGPVAYELQLPPDSKIRNVFHVSLLKAFKGDNPPDSPTLPPIEDGRALYIHNLVLRTRLNRGQHEILITWTGMPDSDATWEDLEHFRRAYPEFELKDKLFLHEGSNIVDAFMGQPYIRKAR